MRVVAAPDKFRGSATAREIAEAIETACTGAGHTCALIPVADGGEGTLDALGGPNRTTTVTGPLWEPVEAEWRMDGETAVIEMARASGLELVGGSEGNDAVDATTTGTGELIAEAVESAASRVIVAVGGSATTDGGLGALRAMGGLGRYKGIDLVVACDVQTRFVDAATVFAAQKGASPKQVELLRRRLERLVDVYATDYGVDVATLPGAGAAGGLAGGLVAAGATLVDGFGLVADEVGLYEHVADADLVVTGEGLVDATSFDGKAVGGVLAMAKEAGVRASVVAGQIDPEVELSVPSCSLVDVFGPDRAFNDTLDCVRNATLGFIDF